MPAQYILHSYEMFTSPAWRHLPDPARRILNRIEVEHMKQGLPSNGRVKLSHADFKEAGVRKSAIAISIRQAEALGFLKVYGTGGADEFYQLTYAETANKVTDAHLLEHEGRTQ